MSLFLLIPHFLPSLSSPRSSLFPLLHFSLTYLLYVFADTLEAELDSSTILFSVPGFGPPFPPKPQQCPVPFLVQGHMCILCLCEFLTFVFCPSGFWEVQASCVGLFLIWADLFSQVDPEFALLAGTIEDS